MASYVLDASALLAVLQQEQGGEAIEQLIADPNATCFVHAINLCEVYYSVAGHSDSSSAELAVDGLVSLGVVVREDLDRPLWMKAGDFKLYVQKNSDRRASIADGLCAALAAREACEVVTSDHPGFEPLAQGNQCAVKFFR